jgi:hypothetical protein
MELRDYQKECINTISALPPGAYGRKTRKSRDLSGRKFGMLEVLKRSEDRGNGKKPVVKWVCRCDCGKVIAIKADSLLSGHTVSCGCKKVKHGYAGKERLYDIWKNMRRRCYDKNNNRYQNYGGRGISICSEWSSYLTFRTWAMSHGYRDDLTIDRIDVNGNYCPENCRWATMGEQMNNMTKNRMISYCGETMSMSMWAERFGISYGTMNHRVQRGWSMEKIELTPERKRHESKTVSERVP